MKAKGKKVATIIENKIPERVRSVRGGSLMDQKNIIDNRIFEHFLFNQYETKFLHGT